MQQPSTDESTASAGKQGIAAFLWRALKYYVAFVGVLIAVPVIAFAMLLLAIRYHDPFDNDDFNPADWSRPVSHPESETCYRGGMAKDIENRFLKPGMTAADIERLLGEPSHQNRPAEFAYNLGMCSGIMMDYDLLHIYFDQDGKFKRSEIVQH